jgi:RNA polymerase sigma-70 factor (ECF subfamily)
MKDDEGERMDDERLAERSGNGDGGAFAELYDRYAKRIYAYHYYRTFRREWAEDLTSQTFVKALEGLHGFRPARGAFSAWLYGIARNCLVDQVRALGRTVSLDAAPADAWDLPDGADVPGEIAERDAWERLKPHLMALGPQARELIILRVWDGLAFAQIARLTGRSEAACKMAYSRAIAALRDAMPIAAFVAFLMQRSGA